MAGKVIDWGSMAPPENPNTLQKGWLERGMTQAYQAMAKQQEALAQRKQTEPLLRQALMKAMVTRQPLKVVASFQNPTETLGGIKDDEEDDGFYANQSIRKAENAANVTFQIVLETIPAGIELTFKSLNKTLRQFVFQGSNRKEYSIYQDSVLDLFGQATENPGLYGILYCTDLVENLGDEE